MGRGLLPVAQSLRMRLTNHRICPIIPTVRTLRAAILLGSSLCLLGGVSLSPLVSLHQVESHAGGHGHHATGHASLDTRGHSHGDHAHASLDVASQRIEYRLDDDVCIATFVLVRPVLSEAAGALSRAVISRPPRSRPPLSLTTVLRI